MTPSGESGDVGKQRDLVASGLPASFCEPKKERPMNSPKKDDYSSIAPFTWNRVCEAVAQVCRLPPRVRCDGLTCRDTRTIANALWTLLS